MSNLSPAASLLWAILSTLLFAFLIYHLYHFDRFNCLRWNQTQQTGAFKRMLTYAYVLSVPLLVVFSVTLTSLKYSYGYIQLLDGEVVPTPSYLWSPDSRSALKVLYIVFSIAWALEMVSHLEELNFWLFLLGTTPQSQPWLHSPYFISWCLGSAVALIGMPVIAGLSDNDHIESYIFLAGSIGSLLITLISLKVVWMFPKFLKKIKAEGADVQIMRRLTKFNEFNNIRMVFRFMFVVPLMILAIDGLQTDSVYRHHLTRTRFWVDFLAMLAAVGVIVSSSITLLVFFPRESAAEMLQHVSQKTRPFYGRRNHGQHPSLSHYQFPRQTQSIHTIDYPARALHKRQSSSQISFGESEASYKGYHFGHGFSGPAPDIKEYLRDPLPASPRNANWLTDPEDNRARSAASRSPMTTQLQANRTNPPPRLPMIHTPGHHLDVDSTRWDDSSRWGASAATSREDLRVIATEKARTSMATSNSSDTLTANPFGMTGMGGLRVRPTLHTLTSTDTFNVDPSVGVLLRERAGTSNNIQRGMSNNSNNVGTSGTSRERELYRPTINRQAGVFNGEVTSTESTPMTIQRHLSDIFQDSRSSSQETLQQLQRSQSGRSEVVTHPANHWVKDVPYEAMQASGMRYSEATHGTPTLRQESVTPMQAFITSFDSPASYEGHIGGQSSFSHNYHSPN